MALIFYIIIYTLVNSAGLALVKFGITSQNITGPTSILQSLLTPKVFTGYMLIAISALIGIKALSLTKFSVFAPIALGLNILFAVLISSYLMKETITTSIYLGIALIIVGVVLVSR